MSLYLQHPNNLLPCQNRLRTALSGQFEYYVNNYNSAISDPRIDAKTAMKHVTSVTHTWGWTVKWAGSIYKHTDVYEYSDGDMWVDTNGHYVTETERTRFWEQVVGLLRTETELRGSVHNPDYTLKLATLFVVTKHWQRDPKQRGKTFGFDVVLSHSTWARQQGWTPCPKFQNHPNMQRAVRALKIVIWERGMMILLNQRHTGTKDLSFSFTMVAKNQSAIKPPDTKGIYLERLVRYAWMTIPSSKKLETLADPERTELRSGFLLFRTVLDLFMQQPSANALLIAIDRALEPLQQKEWELTKAEFEAWRQVARDIKNRFEVLEERVGRSWSVEVAAEEIGSVLKGK